MNLDKKELIKEMKKNHEIEARAVSFSLILQKCTINMQQGIALELLLTVYDLPRKSRHVHVIN